MPNTVIFKPGYLSNHSGSSLKIQIAEAYILEFLNQDVLKWGDLEDLQVSLMQPNGVQRTESFNKTLPLSKANIIHLKQEFFKNKLTRNVLQ